MGGILRKVTLFTLPKIHISDFSWNVEFDERYLDATLKIWSKVAFTDKIGTNATLRFELNDADGHSVLQDHNPVEVSSNRAECGVNSAFIVRKPQKWDPEHPNLYRLTIALVIDGTVVQTNSRKIGFRQIELRGNRIFVNNRPVKLKGVNHHEVHPLRGSRSISVLQKLLPRDIGHWVLRPVPLQQLQTPGGNFPGCGRTPVGQDPGTPGFPGFHPDGLTREIRQDQVQVAVGKGAGDEPLLKPAFKEICFGQFDVNASPRFHHRVIQVKPAE